MDITILLRTAGVGLIVGTVCQILNKTGRDEQAMLLSVAGIVLVLLMLVGQIGTLVDEIRTTFRL